MAETQTVSPKSREIQFDLATPFDGSEFSAWIPDKTDAMAMAIAINARANLLKFKGDLDACVLLKMDVFKRLNDIGVSTGIVQAIMTFTHALDKAAGQIIGDPHA